MSSSTMIPAVFPFILSLAALLFCLHQFFHMLSRRVAFTFFGWLGIMVLCPFAGALAATLLTGEGWTFGVLFALSVWCSGGALYVIYVACLSLTSLKKLH